MHGDRKWVLKLFEFALLKVEVFPYSQFKYEEIISIFCYEYFLHDYQAQKKIIMKNNAQAIIEFKIEKGITTNNMPQEIVFYRPFLH